MDPAELAVILAYGDRHGDKAAAERYKLSHRTLQRYRAAMREGRAPELSKLVTHQKGAAVERCLDLLTETYEVALKRLQEVLPNAEPREVIGAVKIVGELCLTRNALQGEHEQPGGDSPGAAAQGSAGTATTTH
jgi:hypothetical protein